MEIPRWLQSRLVKHFLLAVAVSALLLFVTGWILRLYTRHGDVIEVPDLSGLTLRDLENRESMADFNLVVIDSVYDLKKKKGSIAFQDPPPASRVKRNRTLYLTLVAMLPEQVRMPKLTDMTLRQATAVLETYGLAAGNLTYVPDIARNAVLKQQHRGRDLEAGAWIEKGSRIDLVLGQGTGTGPVTVPMLLGMKRGEAIESLRNALFVPGKEFFEDGNDTVSARVYRTSPSVTSKQQHKPGRTIDLWYRSEKKFDFDAYLKQFTRDSLGEDLPEY